MHINNKSQISLEYVLIFIVILMVTIPSFFLFRNYIYESNDNLILQNVDSLADELLTTATDIYYQGAPSKIILQITVPKQIKSMMIAEISPEEYYLVVNVTTTKREVERFYESRVPIKGDNLLIERNCFGSSGTSCNLYFFDESDISPGMKNFIVEAKKDANNVVYVGIKRNG